MKTQKLVLILITLLSSNYNFGQNVTQETIEKQSTFRQWSLEPALGVHTNSGTDILLSTMVQWNPYKHLAVASYSSYNINNPFQRAFNGIVTEYNYSINQKIGVGVTLSANKSTHSFLFMGGVKYTDFKETIVDPDLDKVSIAISTFSPDYGLMYNYKQGLKKYFFTFRTYIPLYPFPIKGSDVNYLDSNRNNIAMELGVGIKLK